MIFQQRFSKRGWEFGAPLSFCFFLFVCFVCLWKDNKEHSTQFLNDMCLCTYLCIRYMKSFGSVWERKGQICPTDVQLEAVHYSLRICSLILTVQRLQVEDFNTFHLEFTVCTGYSNYSSWIFLAFVFLVHHWDIVAYLKCNLSALPVSDSRYASPFTVL